MAGIKSFGRGRGWAQPKPPGDDGPLPKPGRLLNSKSEESSDHAKFDAIIDQINDENLKQKVEEVSRLMDVDMQNEGFKHLFAKLYEHALKDREFGEKLIKLCNCDLIRKIYDSHDNSFFKLLLNNFQKDYERREILRQENLAEFYSVVSLFTSYVTYRSRNLKVLNIALLSYMRMLLETHTLEDIKLFIKMIVKLGNTFETDYKEDIKDLTMTCREILIKGDVPEPIRLRLLYVIELENIGFTQLPDYLETYYQSQLGEE